MATTGEVFPSAAVSVAEAPWSDDTWNTPTNIFSDNAATANVIAASFDSPDQTFVLKASGFNFSSIPDGSTIDGVICRVNAFFRSGQGSGSLDLCQLLDTSLAKVGTNQCSTPVALSSTTSTIITKGSSSDLWGNSLTAAWVKNTNFGVALGVLATAANADVDIDYVTLEVFYTPPSTTPIGKSLQLIWNDRALIGKSLQAKWNTIVSLVKSNNFDGGTNGVAISNANSGGTSGDAFTIPNVAPVYSNAHPHSGTLGMVVIDATSEQTVEWDLGGPHTEECFVRIYLYLTANPTTNRAYIIRFNTDAGGACLLLRVFTSGIIGFADSTNSGFGADSTNTVALNQLVRVEVAVTPGAGTGKAQWWLYNDADSTTETETSGLHTGLTLGVDVGSFKVGATTSPYPTTPYSQWFDDIAFSNVAKIGPLVSSTPVGKTLQAIWNTAASVGKDLQAVWNTKSAVGKALQIVWNVKTFVDKSVQLVWDVKTFIGKSAQLVWNTAAPAGKSLQTVWNVRSLITKSLQIVWNFRDITGNFIALRWNTRAAIGKSLDVRWNTLANAIAVGKDLSLVWNAAALTNKDLAVVWNTRALTTKSLDTRWNILSASGKSLQVIWNIKDDIGKTLQLVWNVRQNITKDLQVIWYVRTRINKDLVIRWNILTPVAKSISFIWNTRAPVGKNLTLSWNALFTFTWVDTVYGSTNWTHQTLDNDIWTHQTFDSDVWTAVVFDSDVWTHINPALTNWS